MLEIKYSFCKILSVNKSHNPRRNKLSFKSVKENENFVIDAGILTAHCWPHFQSDLHGVKCTNTCTIGEVYSGVRRIENEANNVLSKCLH